MDDVGRVGDRIEISLERSEDVLAVRREVKRLAACGGFRPHSAIALTTAAAELARMTFVRGPGGSVVVEELVAERAHGVRLEFRAGGEGAAGARGDRAGAMDLALAENRRLLDALSVEPSPAGGTIVRGVKWAPGGPRRG